MELLLSIVALAAGPLLFPVAKRHPRLLCGMDGFVLVAIAGLSLFHLLPVAIDHAGYTALLTAVAGLLGPFIFGRRLAHGGQRQVHNAFILVAVGGLAVHAMIDGAALFQGTHETAEHIRLGGMVAAVLIHRVPMSLLVWWSLRPRMGTRVAASSLGALALATGAGYVLGGTIQFTPVLMGHLIAFVAGSLIHVVAHDTASELIPRHCHDAWHATYSAIGGTIAALGLFYFGHMHRFEPAWARFSSLFVHTAPALLIGFTLGGLMEAGFGKAVLEKLRGQTRLTSALRGVFLGTPIPICSCGVETVYRALSKRGVPIAATLAFLLAAPGMTMNSMALSVEVLGVKLTLARLLMAALVALVVAVVASYVADHDDAEEHHHLELGLSDDPTLARRAAESLKQGWVEQIDHAAPWIVVGFAMVAILWPALQGGWLTGLAPSMQVIVLAVGATPFYLNASAMTAVAAALAASGVTNGAVLAMLVLSPSLSLASLKLVGQLHGKHTRWLVLGTGLGLTIALGIGFDAVMPTILVPLPTAGFAPGHTAVEYTAAALLTALFLLSYFRMGPRGMLGQLLPAGHHHMHDHGHSHDEHTHGEHGHHEH